MLLCPSHDDLRGFALGQVPESRVQEVEAHLGECRACVATLQTLPAGDTLTDVFRTIEISRQKLPSGDAVTQTIVRMKMLTPAAPNHDLAMTQLLGHLAPAQAADEIGRIGAYRILGVLGRGGMGIVLLGEDALLGRRAAIKVLSPLLADRASARQRFLREARAAARIVHPAVVDVFHVGEQGGLPYIAMAYLEGESLETRIRRDGPLPSADVLKIGRALADALAAAHRHGSLHRDVKPQNVWLENGSPAGVKLLDFGLSWSADQGEPLTDPGTIIGTPAYMAPEQAASGKANARSDLFALGSVLYAMCAGQSPFGGESVYAILDHVRTATPRPLRDCNPSIPAGLVAVIERLHAKDPARRFQNASEVVRALARLDPCSTEGEIPMRRFRFKASVAALVVLMFGIATLLAGVNGVPGLGSRPADDGALTPFTQAGESLPAAVVLSGEQEPAAGEPKPGAGEPKKKKIGEPKAGPAVYPAALFPFEERGAGVKDLGAKVTDLLFGRLVTKPGLHLVDRADLKKVKDELELNLSGVVKSADATKVGQLAGAKLLISGSVLQVDKKTYLIARIVGTETSRIVGVSVDGKSGDDLAALVEKLADKIADMVKEEAPKLVARDVTKADRLANLTKALKGGARPTVIVLIRERHVGAPRIDPAAQTEIMRLCKETGFTVLDPEEGLKSKADIVIIGEAFSETAIRNGNLVSVKARVELRAVERKTDQVLTADRQSCLVVGLAEQNAAKDALQEAAGILAERVLPKLLTKQ